MSPRPPTPTGTYGEVWVSDSGQPYKARVRFRDYDGRIRTVARFGQTKTAAKNRLLEALRDRQRSAAHGVLTPDSTVSDLADKWHASAHDWATNTREAYRLTIKNQVKPALGALRISELGTAAVNRALSTIAERHGSSAAKMTRTVLTGMVKYAIAHEAMSNNPVRDAMTIPRGRRDPVRALTRAEVDDLCDRLRTHQRAMDLDLPDLVEWMLGTGCRIGEVLAAGHANCAGHDPHVSLDLEAGTWEVNATVVRVKGAGLTVQHRPKTAAGWRVLALPPYCVQMVKRRASEIRFRPDVPVCFPSPMARRLRDSSNTAGDLRTVLDDLGYEWVHSHTFRKTVATRLDEAGWSARQIADQLGHAHPSMTMDVYMGRNVVSAEAARVLDR